MQPEIIPSTYTDRHGNQIRVVGMIWDRTTPKIVIRKEGNTHRESIGEIEFKQTYTLAK